MFTRTDAVAAARKQLLSGMQQPKPGQVIRGLRGLPLRIHCQLRHGTENDIFSYGTIVALRDGLEVEGQPYYGRDFACQDFHGSKAVLLRNARNALLKRFAEDPMLSDCDILPVKALKVVKVAATSRAVTCEILEFCTPAEEELCAALVAAIGANVPLQEAIDSFYVEIGKLTGEA